MRYLGITLSALMFSLLPLNVSAESDLAADMMAAQKSMFDTTIRNASPARPESLVRAGDMYRTGIGTKKNIKEAFRFYDLASKLNYGPGQERIAQLYLNGEGVKEDKAKGVEWLQRAAKNNSLEAMIQLSIRYKAGNGVAKSEEGYQFWRNKAEKYAATHPLAPANPPRQQTKAKASVKPVTRPEVSQPKTLGSSARNRGNKSNNDSGIGRL